MKISIVSHYYNSPGFIFPFLDMLRALSVSYPGVVDSVLVDDHSHELVDPDHFRGIENLRVFRIDEDVAWNMPGARNIGVKEALCEKILLLDADHVVGPESFSKLLSDAEQLKRGQIGQFRRKKRTGSSPEEWVDVPSHINSFLIHKSDFLAVGGYDESFSGNYGHEDKFFKVCCRRHEIREIQLNTPLLAQGHHTPKLDRDKSINRAILDKYLSGNVNVSQKSLSYHWHKIYP